MALLNYTTTVPTEKTIGEIQTLLSTKGAVSVSVGYDRGVPSAVHFRFPIQSTIAEFKLPCRFDGIKKVMLNDIKSNQLRRKREKEPKFDEQVHRVAWRITKTWVAAQLALIEAGQAVMGEVFLPYLVSESGDTLYEAFQQNPQPLLLALNSSQLALSSGN